MLSLSKNFLAYDQARFCSLTLAFPPQASQATFKAVLFLAVDMAKALQTKWKRRFGSPRLILNGFWKITCEKKQEVCFTGFSSLTMISNGCRPWVQRCDVCNASPSIQVLNTWIGNASSVILQWTEVEPICWRCHPGMQQQPTFTTLLLHITTLYHTNYLSDHLLYIRPNHKTTSEQIQTKGSR